MLCQRNAWRLVENHSPVTVKCEKCEVLCTIWIYTYRMNHIHMNKLFAYCSTHSPFVCVYVVVWIYSDNYCGVIVISSWLQVATWTFYCLIWSRWLEWTKGNAAVARQEKKWEKRKAREWVREGRKRRHSPNNTRLKEVAIKAACKLICDLFMKTCTAIGNGSLTTFPQQMAVNGKTLLVEM